MRRSHAKRHSSPHSAIGSSHRSCPPGAKRKHAALRDRLLQQQPLFVDAADHALDVWLLEGHVAQSIACAQPGYQLMCGQRLAPEGEREAWRLGGSLAYSGGQFEHNWHAISISGQLREVSFIYYRDERALAAETLADAGDRAVVELAPVVDDDHARAERLDVVHVMRRQQDRHAALGVDRAQEFADARLGDDIQPDRRLVQVEQLWVV